MMLQATLNNKNIRNQVTSTNQKTYRFTPSSDLTDGTYILNLRVQDVDGNTLTSAASYTVRLTNKPVEIPWLYIILIAIILIIVIVLIILRRMLLI
jgi:subtilase family serine protease